MTMTNDTKHKDLLTATAPSMLTAVELCVAYMINDDPLPTKDEAFVAAQKAIAHATGRVVCLSAKPTTMTTITPRHTATKRS